MAAQREHWGSRFGFILAAAGSAVGLGNIWKFPYEAGQNGGGLFLLIYLAIVFTIGLSVMLAEFAIGRAAQKDPVGSYSKLKGGAWPIAGFLAIATTAMILSFYSVVAGWTIAYIIKTATGGLASTNPEELGNLFGQFVAEPVQPILYHALFMALTVGVVIGGVGEGIERLCKVLMPALFIILLILVIRSVTLPGAAEGLAFYLLPDFSQLDANVVLGALSQAFFSLSLGMGIMITYGSYLSRRENLPGSVAWVTVLDTSVAFLAGLAILPAVFAFGFDPAEGPGLTFVTLPAVFAQMPGGVIFGVLFFLLLTIAALTSSVSLLEVVVAYFVDERGMSRTGAATLFGALIFLLGIPSALSLGVWSGFTVAGMGFLDLMDYLTSRLLLPLGGILAALFVGWAIAPVALREVTNQGERRLVWAPVWSIICKYVAPLAIAWILISGL